MCREFAGTRKLIPMAITHEANARGRIAKPDLPSLAADCGLDVPGLEGVLRICTASAC